MLTLSRVYTYHCAYCSNLFLASTHSFSNLPKRKDPGLDHAIIVPLPPPPKSDEESDSSSSEDDSSEDEDESEEPEVPKPVEPKAPIEITDPDAPPPPAADFNPEKTALVEDTEATKGGAGGPPKLTNKQREKDDYTLILSLSKDRSAKIITREDGFEKRWIWRCGRCRLVTGYQLDDAHFAQGPNSSTHPNTLVTAGVMGEDVGAGVDNDRSEKEKRRMERKRKRYLYILPGAVLPTEELGREVTKKEVDILGEDL